MMEASWYLADIFGWLRLNFTVIILFALITMQTVLVYLTLLLLVIHLPNAVYSFGNNVGCKSNVLMMIRSPSTTALNEVVPLSESTQRSTIMDRRSVFSATVATFGFMFAIPKSARADDSKATTTTLHIVDYPVEGKCGQANVPEKGVFFAKSLGGMVDGPCSVEGYSVANGTSNGVKDKDKERVYDIYSKE